MLSLCYSKVIISKCLLIHFQYSSKECLLQNEIGCLLFKLGEKKLGKTWL